MFLPEYVRFGTSTMPSEPKIRPPETRITARLRHESLGKFIEDYEAEFGAFTEEEMTKVDAEWPA